MTLADKASIAATITMLIAYFAIVLALMYKAAGIFLNEVAEDDELCESNRLAAWIRRKRNGTEIQD